MALVKSQIRIKNRGKPCSFRQDDFVIKLSQRRKNTKRTATVMKSILDNMASDIKSGIMQLKGML